MVCRPVEVNRASACPLVAILLHRTFFFLVEYAVGNGLRESRGIPPGRVVGDHIQEHALVFGAVGERRYIQHHFPSLLRAGDGVDRLIERVCQGIGFRVAHIQGSEQSRDTRAVCGREAPFAKLPLSPNLW